MFIDNHGNALAIDGANRAPEENQSGDQCVDKYEHKGTPKLLGTNKSIQYRETLGTTKPCEFHRSSCHLGLCT